MDPLSLSRLHPLMDASDGNANITIGLVDGPVDLNHPALEGARIRAVKESQLTACRSSSSIACRHGTFVAGILCAKRGLFAPAISPGCTILLRPIFTDQPNNIDTTKKNSEILLFPSSTSEELSDAIVELVKTGARIINLSLGLSTSSMITYPKLQEAYDYARQHGAIIVAASGIKEILGAYL
jgi:subtilisin family serine protease